LLLSENNGATIPFDFLAQKLKVRIQNGTGK
jgi:hypothetical protein